MAASACFTSTASPPSPPALHSPSPPALHSPAPPALHSPAPLSYLEHAQLAGLGDDLDAAAGQACARLLQMRPALTEQKVGRLQVGTELLHAAHALHCTPQGPGSPRRERPPWHWLTVHCARRLARTKGLVVFHDHPREARVDNVQRARLVRLLALQRVHRDLAGQVLCASGVRARRACESGGLDSAVACQGRDSGLRGAHRTSRV